ncbi:MAG: TonB-dependent receptor [Bacteroidota bacterium]
MKISYTIYLLFLSTVNCLAQNFSVSGIVRDKETRQPISYSTIAVKPAQTGAATNNKGAFTLSIPQTATAPILVISSIGYQTDTIAVNTGKTSYDIFLVPDKRALNEVVVTGVSRATLARENPIPIISVPLKKMEQATESNIIDVLVKNVPGLNAVKTGPNISKPFIRGLGYNRVLTLYDGIRQEGQQWGDEHGIEVDAYNIDRAEVVKGPSSLIYGSDAVAGVVGLMPAMPADTDRRVHGKFYTEYQGNNGLVGNGLRFTYTTPHWSYALRGSYRVAKNYTNAIDGRVYNTGFRESNASATIKHTSDKGYSSLNFTLYDNLQGIPDGSRDSLTRRFTYQAFEGNADNIVNRPLVSDNVLNSYKMSPLIQHIQHYRVYTKNHYQLGNGDIDAILAWQQNTRREFTHPTQPNQAGLYVQLNTINYGLNYNTPIFTHTDLSVGINGMYQNNQSKAATDFPIPNYSLFDAGAYAFAKWKYNRWTIGGGLRYDQRYLQADDFYTKTDPTTGFNRHAQGADIAGAYLQFPSFSKTFHGLSLSLGTTYAISNQLNFKANIARGYRAPSITEFASNGLDPGAHIVYLGNRNFNPEFSLQEDIGIELNTKSVIATVSVFNNNISNYIYLSQLLDASGNPIVDAQGNKTYQYQQAKAQLYGIEATFGLHPEGWKGFTFDNALSVTYGFNRNAAFKGTGVQGEYLPLIPPLRLVSSIGQEIKFKGTFESLNLKAEADVNAAQSRYLALNSTETFTPGFTLFNISAGTSIRYSANRSIQLQFQVNNLFDNAYQSNLNRLKYFEYYNASPSGAMGIYNMGRNICFKAIVPF